MATKKFNTENNLKFLADILGYVTYSNKNGSPYIRSKNDIDNLDKTEKIVKQKGSADIFVENIAKLSADDKNKVTTALFNESYEDFVKKIDGYKEELGVSWHKSRSELGATGLREYLLPIINDTKGSEKADMAKERLGKMVEELTGYSEKIDDFNNLVNSKDEIKGDDPVYPFIEKIRKENAEEIKREKDKATEQTEQPAGADEIKEQSEEIKKEGNDMKTYSDVSEVKKEINVLTESMYEKIGKFFTGAEVIYKTEQNRLVKYKGTGAREFVKKQFTEAFAKISKEIVYGDYRERFTKSISTVLENIKSVSVKGETSEQDAKIVESKNKEAKEALKFAISDYFESNSMGHYEPGRTEEVNMTEAMHKTIADFNKVITEVEKTYNNQPNNDKAGEGESSRFIKMPRTSQVDDEEAEKHFEEVQSKIGEFGFISGANGQSGTPIQPEIEDVADETPAAETAEQNAAPAGDPNVSNAGEGENSANDQEDVNDDSNSYTDGELPDYESEKPVNIAGGNGNNIIGGANPTPIERIDENGNRVPYKEETNENNENGVKPRGFFSKIGRWARRHPFIAAITATAAVTVGGALLSAIPAFAVIANGISSLVIGGAAASGAVLAGGLVARGVSDNYKGFIAKYDIEKHQKKIRKGQRQAQRLMDRAAAAMGTNRTSVAAQAANIKTQSVANQALAKNYNAIMDGGRNSKQRAIEAYFEKKNVNAFDKKVKKDTTEFEKIEKKINKLYDLGDIKEAERLEAYLDEEMSKQDQRVAFNDVMTNLKNARIKNRNARTAARNLQDNPYYNGTYNNGNAATQTQSSTYTPGDIYEQRRNNVQPTGAYTQQPVNRVNGANVDETPVRFRASNPAVKTTETGYTATPSNIKADVTPASDNANMGAGNGLVSGVTQTAGEQQTRNYIDQATVDYIAQLEADRDRLYKESSDSRRRSIEAQERAKDAENALNNLKTASAQEREELTQKYEKAQADYKKATAESADLSKQLGGVTKKLTETEQKLGVTKQKLDDKTAETKAGVQVAKLNAKAETDKARLNAQAEVDKARVEARAEKKKAQEERRKDVGVAKEQTATEKHKDNVNKRDFNELEARKNTEIEALKQELRKLKAQSDTQSRADKKRIKTLEKLILQTDGGVIKKEGIVQKFVSGVKRFLGRFDNTVETIKKEVAQSREAKKKTEELKTIISNQVAEGNKLRKQNEIQKFEKYELQQQLTNLKGQNSSNMLKNAQKDTKTSAYMDEMARQINPKEFPEGVRNFVEENGYETPLWDGEKFYVNYPNDDESAENDNKSGRNGRKRKIAHRTKEEKFDENGKYIPTQAYRDMLETRKTSNNPSDNPPTSGMGGKGM